MLDWKEYYKNKKVLVTGHTGFKGSWASIVLKELGADVYGYSLDAPTNPSMYEICNINSKIHSEIGDIRDYDKLYNYIKEVKPDVIIHLAAQPIVRESYVNPLDTYSINVMGTANLLEAVRVMAKEGYKAESVVIITTDKVYRNDGRIEGYIESDELNGYDPYSNSKSCADILTQCYINCFLKDNNIPVSIMRAGNVIGGGDYAKDRLIPDCIRAIDNSDTVKIRNPHATRPFQHVLEPICAYLMVGALQTMDRNYEDNYNIGPIAEGGISVEKMLSIFERAWNDNDISKSKPFKYEIQPDNSKMVEANVLSLNTDKITDKLSLKPVWNIEDAVKMTAKWYAAYLQGEDMYSYSVNQWKEYICLQ